MIPALVLAAGLATRLRPLSLVRAKAALPVAGEPLVRRILQMLARSGVTEIVINLHHLPQTIARVVGDGSDLGVRVRYSWEVPVLGSAGGPRRAIPLLAAPTFLILNGDTLTDLDVSGLVSHHRSRGALVTMAVVPNTSPEKYGGVVLDDDDRVVGFVGRGASERSYHFVGVQVADARAFAEVPADIPYESVGALYPALIRARRGSVVAWRTEAEFFDIGTPADYLATSLLFTARGGSPAGRNRVHESARVDRSVLWDDVVVESGVLLRECVVADGVTVPADTSWHGVSIRRAEGPLTPGEKQIDALAIAPL